jgi:excisionase family DNA binding protein
MSLATHQPPTQHGPFNILAALHAVAGLMTVADVAQLLGKSNLTIRRMASDRRIPSVRIGGDLRFDPSALMLWLSKKDPTLAQAAKQFGLAI